MPRYGFIRDKLDIKFLVLYLMARVAAPIDFAALTDLALCDEGVDYFLFAQSVSELVESEHLRLESDLYSITEKGEKNGSICEESLPFSVRRKCDLNLTKLNSILRREDQVRALVLPRSDGEGFTVQMRFADEHSVLMNLECFSPSQEQADRLADGFKTSPEQVYHAVLRALLEQDTQKE